MRDTREVFVIGEIVFGGHVFALARTSSVQDYGTINASLCIDPAPCVVLNDAALALPDHLQLVLIGHELGHFFLGHRSQTKHGRNINEEIEADGYSVQLAGLAPTRQLLQTMRKTCLRHGGDPSEADIRLAALPKCPKAEKKCIPGRKRSRKRNRRRK